jgi:hypothetical protein
MSETLRRIAEARRTGKDPFVQEAPKPIHMQNPATLDAEGMRQWHDHNFRRQMQENAQRASQQRQEQAQQPRFDGPEIVAAATNARLTPGNDAWMEQATAAIPISTPEPDYAAQAADMFSQQGIAANAQDHWNMGALSNEANAMEQSLADGVERERGDQEYKQQEDENTRAWLNSQAAAIPPVELAPYETPDLTADQRQLGAEMLQAGQGQFELDQFNSEQFRAKPMPEGATPPSRGFAGNSRPQQAEARRAKNTKRTRDGGWADAASAPLPGEETLPPSVAEWNQNRTSAGRPGGMDSLRQAYDISEQTAPTGRTFEEWINSQGLKPNLPPHEAQAVLDDILSRNMTEFPNHDPFGAGGDDPRVDVDDDSILRGRRGVADGTPLDLMSPEQREMVGTHRDGTPRTARGGQYVWDETAVDGAGGFVPRGFNLPEAEAAMARGDVRAAAAAMGIDHMAYGDNMAQLQADVARVGARQAQLSQNYDVTPVPGGGSRLTANASMRGRMDDRRAHQFEQTMARRFARELKGNNIPVGQIGAAYREHLASNPGDYAGAARFVNNNYLNSMRSQQTQDRALAVQQRADQYNRARRYGVSEGMVSFFDSLQNAQTPAQRANILMLAHGSQPDMGWDKMASMLVRGEIDNDAIARWSAQMGAAKPDVQQQIANTVNGFKSAPLDMTLDAQITDHVTRMASAGGQKPTPDQIRAEVSRIALPRVQERLATGQPLNEQEAAFFRRVLSPDLTTFATQVNMDPKSPATRALYQQVHMKAPDLGWLTNAMMGWEQIRARMGGGLSPDGMTAQASGGDRAAL